MTLAELERMQRWCRTTATWMRKTAALCRGEADRASADELLWLIGYEVEQLLRAVCESAETLVAVLDVKQMADIDTADVEQLAKDLSAALRRRRLTLTLSNVEGRTPEEAAAYLAKAEELSTTRKGG